MKNLCMLLVSLFTIQGFSQVGIGTTTPEGALDVSSTQFGYVLPRIALTATNTAAPVVNPKTNNNVLASGTMVYNTNSTVGTYGVIPGIYYWDGSNWVSQAHRYFDKNFTQSDNLFVASSSSYTNIPGLNSKTFTAPYTGKYSITFTGYLGAEQISDTSAKIGYVEGNFKLTINGVDHKKYSYSTSMYTSVSPLTHIYQLFNETNIIRTISLNAGDTCTLNVSYDGDADRNMASSTPHVVGSTGSLGNLCEINVMYIGR